MPFKFERLRVWQMALDYIDLTYQIANALPDSEKFNLQSQLKRTATSVALNIVEGSTGQSDAEQRRFLGLALRSLLETVACQRISARRNLMDDTSLLEKADLQAQELARSLSDFRNALSSSQKRVSEEPADYTVHRPSATVHRPSSTVHRPPSVIALAGGVGGAKLAHGLAQILPPENLTVIVNTGDDFEHLGLTICPDLDTVCYNLAEINNPETGWGRADETFHALESVRTLGGPDWFALGDRDLGTHLARTRRLRAGEPLSAITRDFCRAWGIACTVLPMSDQLVRTIVQTGEGDLPFQEYFVHRRCEPVVRGFRFEGVERAQPAPGVTESLAKADLILFCPSNPWVSLDPILAVSGIREVVSQKPVVAVSPIIGGQAVKGPAAKMYAELGIRPSALAVADHYRDLLSGFVVDAVDEALAAEVCTPVLVTDTMMRSSEDRKRLAGEVLQWSAEMFVTSCLRTQPGE
ncbi:MAG: hypothetical protein Fur0018_24530 [Anaerolineales bacterium]